MNTTKIDGVHIAYQRAGEGPPLVLLHGILSDSRDWRPQVEGLSRDFDIIAWEAPGCGLSADPPDSFSVADYADCLARLIKALDVEPAHVLGLSWGGGLALELYQRHRETVASLILCDTYAGWKGSLPEAVVAERLAQCRRESEMAPAEFIPGWIPGLITDAAPQGLRDELVSIMSDFHPVGFRVMAEAFADLDRRDVFPRIAVPTLLIWGENDRRSPLSVAEQFRESIPSAQLVVIPDAGHVSNMEQPERFNAAVREFLRSVEANSK